MGTDGHQVNNSVVLVQGSQHKHLPGNLFTASWTLTRLWCSNCFWADPLGWSWICISIYHFFLAVPKCAKILQKHRRGHWSLPCSTWEWNAEADTEMKSSAECGSQEPLLPFVLILSSFYLQFLIQSIIMDGTCTNIYNYINIKPNVSPEIC